MLTPHYLAECSDELVRLLGELDESIMRDFVRRLVKAGHITDAAKRPPSSAVPAALRHP